jgi:transcription termination factor Rho
MDDTITGILKSVNKQQFAVRTAERSYRKAASEIMVQPDLIGGLDLTEGAIVTGRTEGIQQTPAVFRFGGRRSS